MILDLYPNDYAETAAVYSAAWRESHRQICSAETLAKHNAQRKESDLVQFMSEGWRFVIAKNEKIAGLVGYHTQKREIGYLYVLSAEQGKGVGGALLKEAIRRIRPESPRLWTLNTNTRAESIYAHYGFVPTGTIHVLNKEKNLFEREWILV